MSKAVFWPICFYVMLTLIVYALFRLFPQTDLMIEHWFYMPRLNQFSPHWAIFLRAVKHSVYVFNNMWIPLLMLGIILGFVAERRVPRRLRRFRCYRMQCLFLMACMMAAPFLMVNVCKEAFGRPRPLHVTEFAGSDLYVGPLAFSPAGGQSFVSGHASSGFYMAALAFIGHRRKRYYAFGIVAGFVIGATRMALGAHYLSDVVFSGLFTLLIIHVIYLLFRQFDLSLSHDDPMEPRPAL